MKLATTVDVDGTKPIREDILSHCPNGVTTLNDLLALIKELPEVEVSSLEVEYVFVRDARLLEEPIETQDNVIYDETSLLTLIAYFEELWNGKRKQARPEQAVQSIEDLWKCKSCEFQHECLWTRQFSVPSDPSPRGEHLHPLPSTSQSVVRNLNPEFQ